MSVPLVTAVCSVNAINSPVYTVDRFSFTGFDFFFGTVTLWIHCLPAPEILTYIYQ